MRYTNFLPSPGRVLLSPVASLFGPSSDSPAGLSTEAVGSNGVIPAAELDRVYQTGELVEGSYHSGILEITNKINNPLK